MLHVISVHYLSPRWVQVQTERLRRHISVPFQTWTSLEGIDPAHGSHFDHVVEQRGSHAGKLNHIAWEIAQDADDDDLLMFLDGDAFPVADPMALIDDALGRAALVAVRRAENVDEPQPHPCFCVTSVGVWRRLPGDWTAGPTWPGARGKATTDVGANLLHRLQRTGTPWEQVLRSNRRNLDPLYFALYGETIYHHGAGFRAGELSPVDRDHAPRALAPAPAQNALVRPAVQLVNRARWTRWERELKRRHARLSQEIYEQIARGGDDWLAQFR